MIVHDRYQNYDSAAARHAGPPVVHRASAARPRRRRAGLPRRGVAGPDRRRAARADPPRQPRPRTGPGRDRPTTSATRCCAGSATGCWSGCPTPPRAGTRPGERKARLLLEVLRDRPADVLRFAHDLKVPPTSNQAERDLRPSKIQQNDLRAADQRRPAPKIATPSSATSPPPPNTASTRSPSCVTRSPADPGCPHYPHPPDTTPSRTQPEATRPTGDHIIPDECLRGWTRDAAPG